MLDVAVWTACAGTTGLFREPVAPLGEVLSAGGLAREGDWVARGGFDFGALRVQRRIETITARYELHDDEALAVLASVRLYEQTVELVEAVTGAQEDGDTEELVGIVSQLSPRRSIRRRRTATRSGPRSRDGARDPGVSR